MTWSISNLFARKACPIPVAGAPKRMGLKQWLPLLGFAVPTLVIGYGFVIPYSCIHGINQLSVGFGATVLGACLTYVAGVRAALRTSSRP